MTLKRTTKTSDSRSRQGFTLIEIMVVITILGLLLTVVGTSAWNKLRESKVTITRARINNLANVALQDYRRHYNRLPDSLEELLQPSDKNFGEPYARPIDLKDSWENDMRYTRISNSKFKVVSLGADGTEGGETDDVDITYPDDFDN